MRYRLAALAMLAMVTSVASSGRAPAQGFANGFPADEHFFPIGVWLQSPANAPAYKEIGVNTFVGLWQGPTEPQLAELKRHGMFAIADQNDAGLKLNNLDVVKAWMQGDEPDNAQARPWGGYGPCVPAAEVARRTAEMKARDPTRPVLINFGPGLADENWIGRGSCTGDVGYYDDAIVGADILSFDIYPMGSAAANVKGRLEYVARGVLNLTRRAKDGQRVWAIIEASALDPKMPVQSAQLRAEVWMALIHGARGIVYFVHEFEPRFREDAIFGHPDLAREAAALDKEIAELAPALNGPDAPVKVAVSSAVPIATMVKEKDNMLYVFAVSMRNEAAKARFALQGVGGGKVEVMDEKPRREPDERPIRRPVRRVWGASV